MKNGLSIIIRNEEQFEKASKFIGEQYCYVKWVPQMAERETALAIAYYWIYINLYIII